MRKKALIVGAAAMLIAGVAVAASVHRWLSGSTVFASGFRKDALVGVRLGTTTTEVEKLLGHPLSTEEVKVPEAWLYYVPTSSAIDLGGITGAKAIPLEYPTVEFGSDGHAIRIEGLRGSGLKVGSTKDEVLAAAGEPHMRRSGDHQVFWRYSRPTSPDRSWEMVVVTFSSNGRVISIGDQFLAD